MPVIPSTHHGTRSDAQNTVSRRNSKPIRNVPLVPCGAGNGQALQNMIRKVSRMRCLFLFISLLQLSHLLVVQADESAHGPSWVRDFSEGLREAQKEEKDLLLVFTGHGWCGQCAVLDREVFHDADFVYETAKSFVFVELDFTFGDSDTE